MTTPETPQQNPDPQVRMRPRRRGGSPTDMVRSLGLVGLAVLGMVMFTFFGQPEHPPVSVNVPSIVQAARNQADFPVLAATTLSNGWYANFADFTLGSGDSPSSFHIGYVTNDEQFFAVDAEDASASDPGVTAAPPGDPVRTESVAGLTFSVFSEDGKETWFHEDSSGAYAITLTGSGSTTQWQQFVSTLSADAAIAS